MNLRVETCRVFSKLILFHVVIWRCYNDIQNQLENNYMLFLLLGFYKISVTTIQYTPHVPWSKGLAPWLPRTAASVTTVLQASSRFLWSLYLPSMRQATTPTGVRSISVHIASWITATQFNHPGREPLCACPLALYWAPNRSRYLWPHRTFVVPSRVKAIQSLTDWFHGQ
jgi:hypothetical protein